jgi:hypothetical protein
MFQKAQLNYVYLIDIYSIPFHQMKFVLKFMKILCLHCYRDRSKF